MSTSTAFFCGDRYNIFFQITGRNTIRGLRTTTIRDEERVCAERMGYHWLANTDSDLPFDTLMYRLAAVVAVRLKKVRYAISDDCIIEKKFPDEVHALRALRLRSTCSVSSGSGRRTSGPGAGSMSCRKQLQKLGSILRKITGTPTSGRRSGKMPPTGSISLCLFPPQNLAEKRDDVQ